MKWLFLILTTILQLLLICCLRRSENHPLLAGLLVLFIALGVAIKLNYRGTSVTLKNLAWGFFWGTLSVVVFIAALIIYFLASYRLDAP